MGDSMIDFLVNAVLAGIGLVAVITLVVIFGSAGLDNDRRTR